jgi:polo-like kinase 1
MASGQPNN